MEQEMQVALTLTVNTELNKKEVKKYLENMINVATILSSSHDRMMIPKIDVTEIKEESEIYNNE